MKNITTSLACERLLQRYRAYLRSIQGLAARTCESRVFYVREFLQNHWPAKRQKFKLQELTPEVLLDYVLERSTQDSAARLQALASALRSWGRFLRWSGRTRHELSWALPRIASPGRTCVSDYLAPEQLQRWLDSMEASTASGRRNYALMLCLARLGLRAGEVAQLTLDQIHWRTGVICLGAGKGRRERQLPLPRDVGQALVNYLKHRTVQADSRGLFCAIRDGKTLSPAAISQVARRALQQAGIRTPRPGAHLLRRTLASHLVQRGVSLKAIADLLGHRCLDTTRIYASVNHSMLGEVAQPWPMEANR
jgi:integrase/recombinase XerD